METIKKYLPFITAAILIWLLLYIIYPHYQYYIDPDGTAYLTIAQRYAKGIYVQAINGYWSPWGCWLTAALIRYGLLPIPASVIINTIAATGVLYISQSLFIMFAVAKRLQWLLAGSLGIFLCYAIFWQSFDDLWECFFLLTSLRILLTKGFAEKPILWAATGAIGALAYFAKAYAFPFFILNTICCTYLIAASRQQWIKICSVAITTMAVVSAPWLYALHYKYGIWTTSTAGSLNTSWYLVGHPYWNPHIKQLLPPAYPDSPYYWEDPYSVNGATPQLWSSWHLFGLQFIRVALNLIKLLVSSLQLSLFFPAIALVALAALRRRNLWPQYPTSIRMVTLSFLLFPLGYILINFEARYLWYMLPLSMIMADFIIKKNLQFLTKKISLGFVYIFFALSIIVYPVYGLAGMAHSGYNQFRLAEALDKMNIHGTFTSNARAGRQAREIFRLAYFSGNPYYAIPYPDSITHQQLLSEIRRYNIGYYLYYYNTTSAENYQLLNEQGIPFPEIAIDKITGIKIFKITR